MIPPTMSAFEKKRSTQARLRRFAVSAAIASMLSVSIISTISWFFRQPTLYDTGWSLVAGGLVMVIVLTFVFTPSGRARTRLHLIASVEERNRIVPDEYHDVHAGAALAALLTIATGAAFILLANAMGARTSSSASLPFVGSVRSPLAAMHAIAQDWRPDAYLADATYALNKQEYFLIWARYRTPSYPQQELSVWLSRAGEYKLYYHNYNTPDLPEPIMEDDWTLDSPEAVSILAEDADLRQCLTISGRRGELQLTRLEPSNTGEVMWCLWMEGCEKKCLDATPN